MWMLGLPLDHPALRRLLRRPHVPLDEVHPLDHDPLVGSASTRSTLPRLPLSLPWITSTVSPFLMRKFLASCRACFFLRHHSTSGASETIFAKFFSRSSRPTGPKIRVPRGFICRSISTAAFSSKPM